MSTVSTRQIYEYRTAESLEEVNRLADEEGYDLFQAVALEGKLRFIVRRVREADPGRRVGFTSPA
ncbi:MAG: hypothetical protein ABSF27_04830 [Candidatus Dormibacteria bacterium]